MMTSKKRLITWLVCAMMMILSVQPAMACTSFLSELYHEFSEILSGGGDYPDYPLRFTLEGKTMRLPCKLSVFLYAGWRSYSSEKYMDAYEETEITLKKNGWTMYAMVTNPSKHTKEPTDCDVREIRVTAFSFDNTPTPDIDVFGIHPRASRFILPEWLKESGSFKQGNAVYSVEYKPSRYENDVNVFVWIYSVKGTSHIYFTLDEFDRVDYFSISAI